jgi:uncharacterized membrane protein
MKKYITKSLVGMIALALIYFIVYSFLYFNQPEALTAVLTFSILGCTIFYAAHNASRLKSKQTVR